MLTSINEISNHPVVVLLYKSGASGEFLSHALNQTIDQFTKTTMHWENTNRCIVQDYFGRTLLSGTITEDVLLPRINQYFKMSPRIGTRHMGISHFQPHQIDFIKNYGAAWPVIEITTLNSISKKFQQLSRISKIYKKHQPTNHSNKINATATDIGFTPNGHLTLEWVELFQTDTRKVYSDILKFLNCTGDADQFVGMINDYVNRNQSLLQSAYAN
jgi:hypothetical protein